MTVTPKLHRNAFAARSILMGGALLVRRSRLQRGVVLHDQTPPPLKDIGVAGSQGRPAAAIQSEAVEPGRERVAADPANDRLVELDHRPVLEERRIMA